MAKQRVLITGGAGFLGSHLCDRFLAEGYQVIAMDNLITGDLGNIEHLIKLPDFEFHHCDVSRFVHVQVSFTTFFTLPHRPVLLTTSKCPFRPLRWVLWAHTTCWAWPKPKVPASW